MPSHHMTQQPNNQAATGGRLGFEGALEFRDAEGRVLKVVQVTGSIPLSDLGVDEKQAAALVEGEN